MMKNTISKTTALFLTSALLLSSCGTAETMLETNAVEGAHEANIISINGSQNSETETAPIAEYSEFDLNTEAGSETVYITLMGDTAEFESENVELQDGILVISDAGDYELSGGFDNQICVNAGADDNVHLILNGVTLSAEMAPLNFVSAKNISITLAEGSVNSVSDSADYTFAEGEDEPNAAIYSKCDLTINGTGELTVYGMYECGIRSKDDLKIVSGNITVHSEGDAIKGKDSLIIRDGNITVQTSGDGLKSNNDEDASRGYVIIEDGTFDITAADDGIHAETWLMIYDGDITVSESYEALEGKKIEIYGGNIDLTASDDGLNAAVNSSSDETDTNPQFDRGDREFSFGDNFGDSEKNEPPELPDDMTMPEMPDDGTIPEMPPDGMMPEMPENEMMPDNAGTPPMNGGEIPSDNHGEDRGGKEMSGMFGGNMGGGFNEAPEDGVYIKISGGTIRVQSGVDVIDSNGTFEQTGGTIITAAPSMTVYGQPDGIIDINGDAYVNGGTFISLARNSGSADQFTNIPGIILNTFRANAGEKFTIIDANGNTIIEFAPEISSSVIFLTSDILTVGNEYTIIYGDITRIFTAEDAVITIE